MIQSTTISPLPIPPDSYFSERLPSGGGVDQRRRVQCLARLLLGQLLGGKPAQLVVNQRQQLRGGLGIALLDGAQNPCDVAHGARIPNAGRANNGRGFRFRGQISPRLASTAKKSFSRSSGTF
jgi:hypothetical protein